MVQGPPVQWSRTIYAFLEEGSMGSYTKFGPVVQEEMSFKQKVYGHATDKAQSQELT